MTHTKKNQVELLKQTKRPPKKEGGGGLEKNEI